MKKSILLFAILSLVILGCETEGPIGPAGQDGIDGTDGTDGKDGNANVRSITKFVAPSDWTPSGTAGEDLFFYYEITIPEITNDIVQNGAVMVYLKADNSPYYALPTSFYYKYLIWGIPSLPACKGSV